MPVSLRRFARRRGVLIVLSALLIAGLTVVPLLPVYSSPEATSKMAVIARHSADEVGPIGPDGGSGPGLQVTLSEGREQVTPVEAVAPAPATPLDDAAVQTISDRLPPLEVGATDVQDFRLPAETILPPRTGQTLTTTFPTTDTAPVPTGVTAGPLEVLRYSPEGEIPIAPFLSVTFNQPMVPLATVEQLAAEEVPVVLTPSIPGIWRWVGTRTLTFEYAGDDNQAFPMATVFTAEVPAGTRSATGEELAAAVSWTFSTPAPRLQFWTPSGSPTTRTPLMFAGFDQQIDSAAVLATTTVTTGGRAYPARLATAAEVEADSAASSLAKRVGENRWLAFKVDDAFPADTTVTVNIGPGTPSAEGPRTTEGVQSFSFSTYAPLRITNSYCSWGGSDCPPFSPFTIEFNNPLDQARFDESWITVEPAIPGLVIQNFGYQLQLSGATQGRTTYKVTIKGDLLDSFGQTLGSDQTITFKTGAARQVLSGPRNNLVTVDPSSGKPTFTFYSVNYRRLRVRIYAVTPATWPAYVEYMGNRWQDPPPTPPGREVMNKIIQLDAANDALTETAIDLSPTLSGPTGHLIVVVDYPRNPLFGGNADYRVISSWVQVTRIGLDALNDPTDLIAWTSDLQTGAPLADVDVNLLGSSSTGTTDGDGVARLALPSSNSELLVATKGDDIAILPRSLYGYYSDGWTRQTVQDEVRWYVFDDRAMYRPGEEVHVKGWVRLIENAKGGDIRLLNQATSVRYQVIDPQGATLVDDVTDVNDLGGFDLNFTLPEGANLGYANINFWLNASGLNQTYGTQYYHNFQIQEFRRPEFAVTARNEEKGPFFTGGSAIVAVEAAYYAGGPLPGADTNWNVTASPGSYSPPNWPGFTFGTWVPWWWYYNPDQPATTSVSYSGQTDPSGNHYLRMDFSGGDARPYSIQAEAVVMDVNRQAWSASTTLLVHPADLYVGLRSARTFVEQGTPLDIDAIVTDLDGNPVEDRPIQMRAARMEWKYTLGTWQQQEADVQECSVGSTLEPVTCSFATTLGGEYRITATIQDAQGRTNQSELTRWVSGGKRPVSRNVEQEDATLIPDKELYQPGDTAEILVQSPFVPAQGLLTLQRNGIVATERFTMTEPSYTLHVPIDASYIPNLYVQVDLVGEAPRTDDQGEPRPDLPTRPAYASGTLNLSVPPVSRTLALTATLSDTELAPGGETNLDLLVTDAAGQPVPNAELAVVVVDEAILALTNYQLADPIATFYQQRSGNTSSVYGRASLVLANPEELASDIADNVAADAARAMPTAAAGAAMPEMAMAPAPAMAEEGGLGGGPGAAPTPITVRPDFNPLAVFDPAVRTDDAGHANLTVKLPDNLTRYRVMVAAVADGTEFGSTEANLTARLPLMVRPSAPRFLNFGDRFELPVVIQNQTNDPLTVDVVVRAGNLTLTEGAGRQLEIPANDRREVRFPATTDSAGTARLQIAAVSGDYADAATVDMPVYTPATTEAFATYGVIDDGAIVQPVAAPADVFPQFGGLEISTSSTALQALTDALLYLVKYRFECSEQVASRILGIAALRDVLTAFKAADMPSPETLEATVAGDITRLQALQNADGGWPVWTRGKDSVPFYSIHVTHALARAQQKGYDVPPEMISAALGHLRQIESYYPYWYGPQTRHTLSAYALYVRSLLGDVDTAKSRNLLNEYSLEDQSIEAIAWIWQVLSDDAASTTELEQIRRFVNNRAVETAGAANFTTSYGDDAYLLLHSNRRTDAVVLDALINDQPDSDLIPKVVTGLLAHRQAGRWNNTQENVFILLALDRYFNTYESITPDFVARMWLGDTYVAAHEYHGRTTDTQQTTVPMHYLTDAGTTQDLTVAKEGDGRLYYRLGLRYAPTNLDLDPLDMGFVVQRVYEPVDDPADVTLDDNGVWHIKAGARVRIRLTMVAENRRYNVALADPLPAGLEPINPALAVSEDIPSDPNDQQRGYWWWWTWYDHQNLRDQRAEAFATLLWEGTYTYTYVARATTPGDFIVPPTKAEEMYSPEVFGRSGSDRVVIE